jgi:hypothetical protein
VLALVDLVIAVAVPVEWLVTRPGDAGRPVDAPVARARTAGASQPRPARTAVTVRAGRTRLSVPSLRIDAPISSYRDTLVVAAEPVT